MARSGDLTIDEVVGSIRRRHRTGEQSSHRDFVNVLGRGLMIIEALAGDDVWLGSSEIANRIDLPKPTVSRLLGALLDMGYLRCSIRTRRYRLGPASLLLGYATRAPIGLINQVRPHLARLANEHKLHVSLCTRALTDVLVVVACHSLGTIMTLRLDAGSRFPLAGTATGHCLLSSMPVHERDILLKLLRDRHQKHWRAMLDRITRDSATLASRGYTLSEGGWETDINGVSAPLDVAGESRVYAIACAGAARHFPVTRMHQVGRELAVVVRTIEQEFDQAQTLLATKGPGD